MTDALNNGERQVAPTLDGIRRDHRARYEWVARNLPPASRVVDVACGVGYGARILAEAGHTVFAIDLSQAAIEYALGHHAHPRVCYLVHDASSLDLVDAYDAAVCFETIEHLADPLPMLRTLRAATVLYASVPNEAKFPFRCADNSWQGWQHHHRHYTRDEFAGLIWGAGWSPLAWYGQEGRESDVVAEVDGRTLVVIAERAEGVKIVEEPVVGSHETVAIRMPATEAAPSAVDPAPAHVAIVGLGPSSKAYFETVMRLGGRKALADETWAVNALGDVLACDRVFHMDDVAVQERRAAAKPEGNIARMVEWLKTHPGPIYTSVVRDGYPGMIPFPIEDVLNAGGVPYFNNTVAYAIGYARFIGVKKLSLYGVDFTRPNVHQGEQGRACCEFWLGLCTADGMEIDLPSETTLMDACADGEHPWFYGYDGVDLTLGDAPDGKIKVTMAPRDLPTAEAVEERYRHDLPVNRLLRGAAA